MYSFDIAFAFSLGNKIVCELPSGDYLIVEKLSTSLYLYRCHLINKDLTSYERKDHLSSEECANYTAQHAAKVDDPVWKPLFPANF